MTEEEYKYELALLEKLWHSYDGMEGLWVMSMIGFVDYEMEKRLLLKEYESCKNHGSTS